jgi:surface carbohydrate biosynthesis protein
MKLHTKKIAYCFLVSSERRDFYLLIPIIYFLENYLNYTVSFEFVWDADKIRRRPPHLVLLPNTRGNSLYYEIGKYCEDNQIPLFAHDSEGNFSTAIPYDFWAYNLSKRPLTLPVMTWNARVKDFLMERYALPRENIVVTGAPGFDKYQYLKKKDRALFLQKYGQTDKRKIIGYAGWAFGKLENKELNDLLSNINKSGDSGKQWLEAQRDAVEDALKKAIEHFPDYLFVLKKHPRENFESDLRDSRNEMNRLTNYPNVLYLKESEEIQDLIEVSDLWVAFESTSIMEAWLSEKPTVLINPDVHFTRSELYKGSAIVYDAEAFLNVLSQFDAGDLSYFNQAELLAVRNAILSNSIGFTDGLNHLRAINCSLDVFSKPDSNLVKPSFNWTFFKRSILLNIGRFFFIESIFKRLPKFKKTVWLFKNRSLLEINQLKPAIYKDLDQFYVKQDLPTKIQSDEIWKEI